MFAAPITRPIRDARARRLARWNVDAAKRWRRKRVKVRVLELVSYLGAVLLVVSVAASVYVMIARPPGFLTALNRRCDAYSQACGTAFGFLTPILSLALASAAFLFYRLRYVKRPVVQKAKKRPQDLVQTATPNIGTIVGRDELCRVIMEDIRVRGIRRPHLVVGGVGTGKTAVLVQLTKLLAERGAVPVPIRLRDTEKGLNFRQLAYERFMSMTEERLSSTGEAEKVWRQLCKDDQVVVLADGLEEALAGGSEEQDRDNLIRLAIQRARELELPLVIASRPHDPLRGADATIMELDPLSEDAALEYILEGKGSDDLRRLNRIVETAGLAELPLYLQITRQLYLNDRLDHLAAGRVAPRKLDTRGLDRSELRFRLLDTWMEALFEGHLMAAVPLDRNEREAAVAWISALACIGLKSDTIDVKYDHYFVPGNASNTGQPKYPGIDKEVRNIGDDLLSRRIDIRLAASWGDRLGLVEVHGDGVRFPHSIMEAYLGSRFMPIALEDPVFQREAAAALAKPGREFLIALVLHSRSRPAATKKPDLPQLGESAAGAAAAKICSDTASICEFLTRSASACPDDVKKLDLYAAALEIDSILDCPRHDRIAKSVSDDWSSIRGGDQRTMDEAKMGLVLRFADAVRTIADRRDRGDDNLPQPAYRDLFAMGCGEHSYRVRLAIAQEIGSGGDIAFGLLHDGRRAIWATSEWPGGGSAGRRNAQAKESKKLRGNGHNDKQSKQAGSEQKEDPEDSALRSHAVRAWLAPMLVGSTQDRQGDAQHVLRDWLKYVGHHGPAGSGAQLQLSLEIALAQGFKYAANRRRRHPLSSSESRDFLAEQATEMLENARFWFSQLTLIQALCLWELPEPEAQRRGSGNAKPTNNGRPNSGVPAHGSDPEAIVGRWLELAKSRDHPFVAEAGKLAVRALQTRRPQRFLWIDECGVALKVGSRAVRHSSDRQHHLWIPPSTGWAALDPRAQQLVADVLLVLNLAERGEGPMKIEQRLRRIDRVDLPPCLSQSRDPLDPTRTIGAVDAAPGSNCRDGCPFGLCPYPPNGKQPYRAELSEAFCHRQQTLLSGGWTRSNPARWQSARRGNLMRFWEQMGDRARGSTAQDGG